MSAYATICPHARADRAGCSQFAWPRPDATTL